MMLTRILSAVDKRHGYEKQMGVFLDSGRIHKEIYFFSLIAVEKLESLCEECSEFKYLKMQKLHFKTYCH